MEYWQHSQILPVLVIHGLVTYPDQTSEDFWNTFCSHLMNGDCYQDDLECPGGCTHIRAQFPPLYLDQIMLGRSIISLAE